MYSIHVYKSKTMTRTTMNIHHGKQTDIIAENLKTNFQTISFFLTLTFLTSILVMRHCETWNLIHLTREKQLHCLSFSEVVLHSFWLVTSLRTNFFLLLGLKSVCNKKGFIRNFQRPSLNRLPGVSPVLVIQFVL